MKHSRTKKLPSIQKVLGEIGEHFVQKHLANHSDAFVKADRISYVAQHLLSKDLSEDFDYNIDAIRSLTDRCRNSLKCVRFDANKRPCLKDSFYKENYNATVLLDWHDTGDNKFRYYCATKLSKLEILSYLEDFSPRNKFILDYLVCSAFIANHYESTSSKNYSSMSEVEKKEWSKYWSGHPGRLDFFLKKNNEYYCIDSKVNSSKLSLWQHVRMNWMMKCGYTAQIYNVKIKYPDKDKLIRVYVEEGINSAMELANPELHIIDYDYSMSEDAEKLTSDRNVFLSTAQMTFPWENSADSLYLN